MADVDLNNLKTVSLRGVEILAEGTWTGAQGGTQKYTAADLKEFAAAHAKAAAAGMLPTVYLGHNESPEKITQPAVGQITKLYVKGKRLLADLNDVPAQVGALIKSGAYRGKSIEGFRFRTDVRGGIAIAGERFKQLVTGLALLGKDLPAVDGLNDVTRLYEPIAAEDGQESADLSVFYPVALAAATDSPAETPEPDEIGDRVALEDGEIQHDKLHARNLVGLDKIEAALVESVAGERDAPVIRMRLRALRRDYRQIMERKLARLGLTHSKEIRLVDRLALALGLAKDASPESVLEALVKLGAGDDPTTALAVIGEILGLPDGAPGDIVAKVRELVGGSAAPAEGEDTAMEKDNETVANSKDTSAAPAESPATLALTKQVAELLKFKAEVEGRDVTQRAESLVDAAVRAGKFYPSQRETLVNLAKLDAAAFTSLAEGQTVQVKLGERGTAGTGAEGDEYAATPAELDAMTKMGIGRETAADMIQNAKRVAAGLEPANAEAK